MSEKRLPNHTLFRYSRFSVFLTVSSILIGFVVIATLILNSLFSPSQKTEPIQSRAATAQSNYDRFGIGGGCDIAHKIGVKWVYLWGHGSRYANQAEEDCWKTTKAVFFY